MISLRADVEAGTGDSDDQMTSVRSDSRTIWRVGRKEREAIVIVLFVSGGRKRTRIRRTEERLRKVYGTEGLR